LIREYLFPLSLWNLNVTKLRYEWTWEMVLYLLKWKFPDHPDFAIYFDPIELTESDEEVVEAPIFKKPKKEVEEELSSEEEDVLEYDVLLYLEEDKKRRRKTKKYQNIGCLRSFL
jgi:hypothetical protein